MERQLDVGGYAPRSLCSLLPAARPIEISEALVATTIRARAVVRAIPASRARRAARGSRITPLPLATGLAAPATLVPLALRKKVALLVRVATARASRTSMSAGVAVQ